MLYKSKSKLSKQWKTFFLLFHTVKYLRWKQIWFRLYYQVRKVSPMVTPQLPARTWLQHWEGPYRISPLSIISLNNVVFLDEPGNLNSPDDWNCRKKSKIWLYNLHYFDALNSIHAVNQYALLQAFIDKWTQENPPCQGNGWEPYPLSIRLVNLVKWYSRSCQPLVPSTGEILGMQAQALMQQIEYHIGGNHLFINGKALLFIGAFFKGKQADVWINKGLKLLDAEMKEQFLNDGAHYELSPMYHALICWDLCDLINLANRSGIPELLSRKEKWQHLLVKALTWLQCMCHPDGGISFFNDASFGIAPSLDEIQQYCNELNVAIPDNSFDGFSLTQLKESGYCVVNMDNNSKAILDVGEIGPSYQPGHAHADSLSFELSLYGERVLVNSGISHYGSDLTRQLQRGTKAHNTVTINYENSSEVWSGFRVARRAHPKHLSMNEGVRCIKISCSHDGYRRLPGRNWHERRWEFLPNRLIILDTIHGVFQTAEARLYFHPDVSLQVLDNQCIQGTLASGKKVVICVKNAFAFRVEPSTWHPYFGVSEINACVVATFKNTELVTELSW